MRSLNDRGSNGGNNNNYSLVSLHIHRIHTAEIDVISDSSFLTEADTLVSPAGTFELGFFRPGTSDNKYVGIWYKKIPSNKTVVWVANRDLPLTTTSSGTLKIISPGNLVLVNDTNDALLWSTNTTSVNAIVKLDDTGNLIVIDGISNKILWESFDFPTDTLLPGMKFGRNYFTGKEWHLSSWKSTDQDPYLGEYTWTTDTNGYPQNLVKKGTSVTYRSGPWNGRWFSGDSGINDKIITAEMFLNETRVVYRYFLFNTSVESRLTLNSSGMLQRWVCEDGHKWQLILQLPNDFCGTYNMCHVYGTCRYLTSKRCVCLDAKRFMPRNQKDGRELIGRVVV